MLIQKAMSRWKKNSNKGDKIVQSSAKISSDFKALCNLREHQGDRPQCIDLHNRSEK